MIVFDQLTKRYRSTLAIDRISFTVQPGTITGLLGPNGAGKSTALRILTGMAQPTSGVATIAGRRYDQLQRPAMIVGSLLDSDCFHRGRTGLETLRIACRSSGLPPGRVEEVLAEVGLTRSEAERRIAGYSLGMRQRLGLAQALLGRPAALILDEPANGLDPQGQRWLADLLRSQAERGSAVLLSSHQLAEVERLADRLVIIGSGRVVADERPDAIRAEHGDITDFYFNRTGGHDRAA
jgi:ABC-2 type transport system ATP-binding protein